MLIEKYSQSINNRELQSTYKHDPHIKKNIVTIRPQDDKQVQLES